LNFFSLFKRKILYKLKKKINIDLERIEIETLDKLFQHYKSDKSDKFHGFSNFYDQNLQHLRNKEIKILEVGSYAGASASAFVKHFTKSSVYCFDINISKFIYYSDKIFVYGLDINNNKKVEKIIKEIKNKNSQDGFDIIIDDGSHYLSDILSTFKKLFKHLKSKGFYIIEDFKYPNYYNYNNDVKDILVDQMLKHLSQKSFFNSKILSNDDQIYLHKYIDKINIYKGNLKNSDICFIQKK
tara:strand:+ start:616 stop:1338 length:723 start_codon:yes stop_codon:yes gene_type:complete